MAVGSVGRHRLVVMAVATVLLGLKLTIAADTFGSNDINHWTDFVNGVADRGPVGVYGIDFPNSLYNHPPLIGYFLVVVHWLVEAGVPLQFTIRAVSSVADMVSSLLVFELLSRRRSLVEATAAGSLLASSPVLFVISGYHGNTDPDFVMLTLLALYLLVERDRPGWAGLSLALALGVKIVPVVAVPALLVWVWRRSPARAAWFAGVFAVVVLLLWVPALATHWSMVRTNVLGYDGIGKRQWGFVQLSTWAGIGGLGDFLAGSGRFLVVLACGLGPAALLWRRPALVVEAVGLALAAFMFFSPAFATQYLVWPVAAAYLLGFTAATAYNLLAGGLLLEVYTRWSGGLPWNHARGSSLTHNESVFAVLPWVVLGGVVVLGIRRMMAAPQSSANASSTVSENFGQASAAH